MGKTDFQRYLGSKQPYTRTVSANGGQTFTVFGYSYEFEDGKSQWKEHDLGSDFSLDAAREVAEGWKAGLVGVYPLSD